MLLYLPTEIPSAIEIFLSYNSILSKLVEEKTNKQHIVYMNISPFAEVLYFVGLSLF